MITADIEKASFWKRISAFLFDMILLVILSMAAAMLLSVLFQYDRNLNEYQKIRSSIEEEYGVSFDITESEYNEYTEEAKANYDRAYDALNGNREAVRLYTLITNFALLIITFSLLIGFLVIEFLVPMLFKNGQTLGKKIFGIALVRQNGVKISGPVLFIRTVLGKYAVETMIPVMIILMTLFGRGNILLVILLFMIPVVNLIMVIATKNNCFLHDMISMTCVVDFATQRIFDSAEEISEYYAKKHEEELAADREENVFSK